MTMRHDFGYFLSGSGDGYWGVYPISAKTSDGTVDERHVISAHGSADEARAALSRTQQGAEDGD